MTTKRETELLRELESLRAELQACRARLVDPEAAREMKFLRLVESAQEGILVMQAGQRVYLNPRWLEMSGYSAEAYAEIPFLALIEPEDLELVRTGYQQVESGQSSGLALEFRFRNQAGETRWATARVSRIDWESRPAVLLLLEDITERKQGESKLNASATLLRNLINSTPDIICFKDGEGRWLEANEFDLRVFELNGVDYHGKKDSELAAYSSFYREAFLTCEASDEQTWQLGRLSRGEEVIHRPDGSSLIFDVIKVPNFDEQGRRQGLIVVGREITERKRTDQELQESEKKYRTLLQNIQVGVVVHASDTSILFSNPRASELLGLTAEQMRGKSAVDPAWCFVAEDGTRVLPEAYPVNLALQATAPLTNLILGILRPDREGCTWVQCDAHPDRDADGRVSQVVVTFMDITERKQAEEALQASDRASRRLAQHLEVVYAMSAEIASGLDFEQLIERLYRQCQRIGDTDTFYLAFYGEAQETITFPIFFKDGERRSVEACLLGENSGLTGEVIRQRQALYFPDLLNLPPGVVAQRQGGQPTRSFLGVPLLLAGQVVGVLSIQSHQAGAYTDDQVFMLELLSRQVAVAIQNSRLYHQAQQELAERERAEQQIRLLNEKLEERVDERTRELREAQEKLVQQERLAILGRLAGGVAHELRNPLGVISNAVYFLDLILPQTDLRVKEYLEILRFESQTATRMTSDLLDFSALQPGDRQAVGVAELVKQALEQHPVSASVSLTLDLPQNLPPVFVDPHQIGQALGNLVVNACQAMPNGGRLTFSARLQAKTLAISVQDTGLGISPENLPRLFEPLFSTKPRGLGLGLVISQKLIEINGGKIEIQSEVGVGTTCTVSLPRHRLGRRRS